MESVTLTRLIDKMKLVNLTPEIDVTDILLTQPDINRPALQLAGYFEHFDATRLQIIGFVESSYMENLSEERKREIYNEFMGYDVSAVVFCRELKPDPIFMEAALAHRIPLLSTRKATSAFMAEAIRWLNVKLAPCISIHGVLVDVYGEGVLITGDSGIGKSEAALELIRRGHRLVTDDVVEIRAGSAEASDRTPRNRRGECEGAVRRVFGHGHPEYRPRHPVGGLEQGKRIRQAGAGGELCGIPGQ